MGQGSGVAMSCDVGCKCGLDLKLLWLWLRPAAAAPICPLAWDPPYATGMALKKTKKKKKSHPGRIIDKWDRLESPEMNQNISKNLVHIKVKFSYQLRGSQ